MRLENYLLHEIAEAQRRSMELLLQGWDQEIAAAAKALKKAQEERSAAESQGAYIAALVQGMVAQAASTGRDDISISIPTAVGIEGLIGAGTSVDELSALIAHADGQNAQAQAVEALRNGTVPKDSAIADIFGALKDELKTKTGDHALAVDALGKWEARFRQHDALLQKLDQPAHGDPALKLWLGSQRLEVVHASVKLLEAHRPERTLRLIGNPKSLLEDPSKIVVPPKIEVGRGAGPKMGQDAFERMLNELSWIAA